MLPDVEATFSSQCYNRIASSPAYFADLLKKDAEKYATFIREANIHVQ